MLMAHPAMLTRLVEEYERESELRTAGVHGPGRQQMEDVVHTLCVSTGTWDIDAALATAREWLHTAWLGDAYEPAAAQAGRPSIGAAG
ncbi:DUF5133 domain-containing protein [Streptomyces sp. NPDC013489]|uniref:DUF5133 domain-containing protein n=1 Tax=Streptomyces sp. NPDC013489 TaxID=3155606 RepID=UPI0033C0FB0D